MNVMSYVAGVAQVGIVMLGAPLVIGLMRQVRARAEGRAGGGVLQPWRDLRKQLGKQSIRPHGTTVVFTAAPAVVAGSALLIAATIPIAATGSPLDATADLFAVVGLLFLGTVALSFWRAGRRPQEVALPLWSCGAEELTPRMQYTATSFAEPLQRVFDDVLQPDTDVEITPFAESRYMVAAVTYRARIGDAIERRLYGPVIRAVWAAAQLVRRAHTGSVHLYLAYGALGVLIMLVVAR